MHVVPLVVVSASVAFSTPAEAAGTTAGTTISNTATASYNDPGGVPRTATSNQVDIRVDELLNVTVAKVGDGSATSTLGSTNQAIGFTVTNTGNGPEAFRLTATSAIGGDQFDPSVTAIAFDTNGNGLYDPGVDEIYMAGSNEKVLQPDTSTLVFIVSTIPGSLNNLDRGNVDLTAAAVTGTGAPGTLFAGQGQNGSDAIVGATGAQSLDHGYYVIQSATIAFVKSATVLDPFGGTRSVPGSIITYTLVATVSGSGSLTNLAVSDAVPAGTTYQAGTITLEGSPLTDATGDDAGQFTTNTINVQLGTVASGQTRTITFKTRIN